MCDTEGFEEKVGFQKLFTRRIIELERKQEERENGEGDRDRQGGLWDNMPDMSLCRAELDRIPAS